MPYVTLFPASGSISLPTIINLSSADKLFLFLFVFRYLRFVVHFVTGCFLYKPAPQKEKPRYTSRDVAVIIPTVAPYTKEFIRCCETVLANRPLYVVICGVGEKMKEYVDDVISAHKFRERFPDTDIKIVHTRKPNKRQQVARSSLEVDPARAAICINVDDHVYWKPTFLRYLVSAFEDPSVGFVGTNKRVIRNTGGGFWKSYTNFLACIYLTRHNFQIRSEPYLDGAVFVVSGRTYAIRTSILRSEAFRASYLNEYYFFGLRGPLNVDEDNCITRWMLRNDWKIKIQYTPHTEILTPLGNPDTFYGQLVSAAAVWDPLLVCALRRTGFYLGSEHKTLLVGLMVGWILFSKMVKIAMHFVRHPADIVWLPGYLAFAYAHSFIKVYCLFTFYDHNWSGRDLADLDSVMEKEKLKLRLKLTA